MIAGLKKWINGERGGRAPSTVPDPEQYLSAAIAYEYGTYRGSRGRARDAAHASIDALERWHLACRRKCVAAYENGLQPIDILQ